VPYEVHISGEDEQLWSHQWILPFEYAVMLFCLYRMLLNLSWVVIWDLSKPRNKHHNVDLESLALHCFWGPN
jgi:hypothetical protein